MQKTISRWFMFALLIGWALTHATVFAQPAKSDAPIDKIRVALDKKVTLDYTGQSLTDVLNHFREKTGIAINVDQQVLLQMGLDPNNAVPGVPMAQVQVKATNEKAGQGPRYLANSSKPAFGTLQQCVLVSTQ